MNFFKNEWDNLLENEFNKPYFKECLAKVDDEYKKFNVFPPREKVFSSLKICDYNDIKVVILGQDPYHEMGQAHGLCFSVMPGVKVPPSLVNIYKEMKNDVCGEIPNHGNLMHLAKQGVLLLNTVLTVREGQANSHKDFGWQTFTDEIIKMLSKREESIVFMLWGRNAINKANFIDSSKHLVLTAPHPSPLSSYRGFFGSKPFSQANRFLEANGIEPIDWQIDEL
jgi:uracil-DNA glycosylase